jgi:hypothetical protein
MSSSTYGLWPLDDSNWKEWRMHTEEVAAYQMEKSCVDPFIGSAILCAAVNPVFLDM